MCFRQCLPQVLSHRLMFNKGNVTFLSWSLESCNLQQQCNRVLLQCSACHCCTCHRRLHPWNLRTGYAGSELGVKAYIVFLHQINGSSDLRSKAKYMTSEEGFRRLEEHGCVDWYVPRENPSGSQKTESSSSDGFKRINQTAFETLLAQVLHRGLLYVHLPTESKRAAAHCCQLKGATK
jgi:hypothetical protein